MHRTARTAQSGPGSAVDRSPGRRVPVPVVALLLVLQLAGTVGFLVLDAPVPRAVLLAASPVQAALAVALATWLRRPERAWPWYLLAFGLVCSGAGFGLWYLSPFGDGPAGDAAFLTGYLSWALALLGLNGLRSRRQLLAALDAALVTVGLAVLSWTLVVSPADSAPGVTLTDRVLASAYPLLDALMVALAAGLVLLGRGRRTVAWLLLLWAVLLTAADTAYVFAVLAGSFAFGAPVTVVWMLGYLAASAAALLTGGPSVSVDRAPGTRRGSLALAVAAVVPLAVLLVARAVEGSLQDVGVIACGSVLMTVLAVLRGMLVLTSTHRTRTAMTAVRQAVLRSTAGFVVLALLPVAGLSWVAVTEARGAMNRQVEERLSVTAAVSADYVEQQAEVVQTVVTAYASRQRIVDALSRAGGPDTVELRRQAEALLGAHPAVQAAWVLDARGALASTAPASFYPPAALGPDDFRRLPAGSPALVTDAVPTADREQARWVVVADAVRDDRGAVLGLTAVAFRLDAVVQFADRLADAQEVQLTVTDGTGHVLSGRRTSSTLLTRTPHEQVRAALSGGTGTAHYDVGDGRVLAAYGPVDRLGWSVVAEVPETEALDAVDRLTARVVVATVLIVQLLLAGLVLAVRADSRRRVLEGALTDREEHLRGALHAAGDAYVAIDAEDRITAWNSRADEVFGYSAEQAVGSRLVDLVVPERHRAAHLAGLARVLRGGEGKVLGRRVELEALHADGHVFPAELTLWASGAADAPAYHGFVRDLTEVRAQAVELAAAHAAALEGSRLKSEFVANMSHEIRTPMNGVLGMTALLQDTDLDPLQRDYVDTVGSCAESLLTVIDDILDFSKIEAGKLEVEAVDTELRPLVEEVAGLLSSAATGRDLEVVAWIDPAVPAFVHGDPHRLRQVLSNLVGNAVKYTERGEVVVRVQPSDQGEDRVLFSVRDTGIGITAEQRLGLFEAFAQADASTTRKYGGTGLGLTISRQLVELMGGRLDVQSTAGTGSTFFFDLPLPAVPAPAPLLPLRSCLDGVRVLVVDDNATNRQVLEQYLTAWALEPTSVPDAEAALVALRDAVGRGRPYDVLVLDLQMPGTDGLELARAVRADASLARVPMVMLTSTNARGERSAARAAGIGAYLTKPVRQAQLYDRLREVLGPDEAERAVPAADQPARPAALGSVLVAEDNPVNQRVVQAMLTRLGYAVDLAEDGRRAVELASSRHYDVLLMDCQMPELDGFAATRAIRAAGGAAGAVPIIALTASALATDEQHCREAGMDDFLSKPVRREALATALQRWTTGASARVRVPGQVDGRPDQAADGLDRAVLDDLLGLGDASSQVIRSYLDTAPGRLDELEAAASAGDRLTVGRIAHLMAGSSGCIGATVLAASCSAIEQAVRTGEEPDRGAVLRLRLQHDRAAAALQELLVGQDGDLGARAGR